MGLLRLIYDDTHHIHIYVYEKKTFFVDISKIYVYIFSRISAPVAQACAAYEITCIPAITLDITMT